MVENRFKKQILVFSFIIPLLFSSGCINISNNENNTDSKKDTLILGVMSADSIYPLDMSDTNYWTIFPNVFMDLLSLMKISVLFPLSLCPGITRICFRGGFLFVRA